MARRIDDRDSQLIFTPNGAWTPGGSQFEYMGTTIGTKTVGARMSFNFTGTGVEVYGTISGNLSNPAVSNRFTLDGGTPFEWSPSPRRSFASYNAKMFSAQGLKVMTHSLVMVVMVNNSETGIDYVEYTPSKASSTPSQLGDADSSSSTRSGSNGGTLSLGTVAGISVGVMSGLFLLLFLAVWGLRRRWRRLKNRNGQIGAAESEQMNESPTDTRLNNQAQLFLLFASTAENSRRNTGQSPTSSGGVSRPIRDRGLSRQPSVLRLDDPPPSYASQ
ncbi:hypothetical protein PM082_023071 [Marasmius tenuissimus]|nr:hypothetical protein PM082_023071 [Marasmius tenuissimus]